MYSQIDLSSLIPYLVAFLVVFAFYTIAEVLLFRKAGLAGWEVIVPIYSQYCAIRIGGMKPITILLYFVPVINAYFMLYVYYRVFKCFGCTTFCAIWYVLFSWIFLPVVAFSKKYQYMGVC